MSFVVAATPAAVDAGVQSGDLVKSFLPAIDGRGGGRPDLAQGGGTNPAGVAQAVEAVTSCLATAEVGGRN